jgi:N-acetylneuraminate synthase
MDSKEILSSVVGSDANGCFVIAEIGINHNGSVELAKRLIDMAVATRCDAVKFQKRTVEIVYPADVLDTPRESPWGKTTRDQKLGLELGEAEYDDIDAYCKERGIPWFASAWDIPSQRFLRKYHLRFNKIASAMLTHLDFLKVVAGEQKTTFLSTGMSTFADIDRAVDVFRSAKCPIILMHAVSVYPAQDDELHLNGIRALAERYNIPVGYSGHEVSPMPSIVAAALGAIVIERHITLDRAMYGSDQSASLEQRGLEIMVNEVKRLHMYLGNGEKTVSARELAVARKLRYFETNLNT